MSSTNLIVWDLDDTLLDNVHDYSQPILDSISLIVQTLGRHAPHVKEIMRIEDDIDKGRIKEINPRTGEPYLFGMDRFPGSLVETYRFIAEEVGEEPIPEVESQLSNIGLTAFDPSRYAGNIKPGVLQVLQQVRDLGADQVLLTKGDQQVQENKLAAFEAAGLLTYFEETKIVPTKGAAEFLEVAAWAEAQSASGLAARVSIGNSYGSDIAPALEAGYIGIHVPVWNWEEIHMKDELRAAAEANDAVTIVDELVNVPEVLAEIL